MDPLLILILVLTVWLIVSRWWVMTWDAVRDAAWYRRFDGVVRIAYVALLAWYAVGRL